MQIKKNHSMLLAWWMTFFTSFSIFPELLVVLYFSLYLSTLFTNFNICGPLKLCEYVRTMAYIIYEIDSKADKNNKGFPFLLRLSVMRILNTSWNRWIVMYMYIAEKIWQTTWKNHDITLPNGCFISNMKAKI